MQRLYFIASWFLLLSCETIVDVDIPAEKKRITLNAYFSPDSIWSVRLSESQGPLASNMFVDFIEDATVVIHREGTVVDTLALDTSQYRVIYRQNGVDTIYMGLYKSRQDLRPVAGKTFEVTASAGNFDDVSASSFVPPITVLQDNITVKFHENVASERYYTHSITAQFTDDATLENYYEVVLFQKIKYYDPYRQDTVRMVSRVGVFTENENHNEGHRNQVIFSDRHLNGKLVSLNLKTISNYNGQPAQYLIAFRSVSEDYFNYRVTQSLQDDTEGDPFAQPVNVYNNIAHGFGIFAGFSQSIHEANE